MRKETHATSSFRFGSIEDIISLHGGLVKAQESIGAPGSRGESVSHIMLGLEAGMLRWVGAVCKICLKGGIFAKHLEKNCIFLRRFAPFFSSRTNIFRKIGEILEGF